jgi:alkylation response protein AidB-like acyl-CoA dehydrogenase
MAPVPPLSPREAAVVERARAFARDHVAPCAARWERERLTCESTLRAAARDGLAGLLLPESQGGSGLSLLAGARVFEELAAAHLPFAFSLVVHANLVRALGALGGAALREAWLARLLSGESIGAFCLTEPGAGSDAAAIRTRAARDAGGWRVEGEKAWVTNGAFADLASVYAQSDPTAGWRGVVALLVPLRAPGVERTAPYDILGAHAMGTNGLRFAGAVVAGDALLAPPGEGFRAALAGIDVARVLLAAMCVGVLGASLEHAVAYARERRAFGRTIAEFQGLQWSLADAATDLAAARALADEAARRLDAGVEARVAAAHAKKFATGAARRGVAACMQAMGAAGLHADHPLGRHLVGAQVSEYLDGTTGIQNVVIARDLFRE